MLKIDMRKFSERRIALGALLLSAISLVISTCTSLQSNKLSESSICFTYVSPKLDLIKDHIHTLPKFLSGCSIEPAFYCEKARSTSLKVHNLVQEVRENISENNNVLDELSVLSEKTLKLLSKSGKDLNAAELINVASKLNKLKSNINKINPISISCEID